jgi:hypothetical protein
MSYQVKDLHEEYFRVQGKLENTMSMGLRAIFIAFTISQFFIFNSVADESEAYLELKPWTTDANVNGIAEEKRREWLAKIRLKKKLQKEKNLNQVLLALETKPKNNSFRP